LQYTVLQIYTSDTLNAVLRSIVRIWLYFNFILLPRFLMAKMPDNDFFYFLINKKWRHNTVDHPAAYVMSVVDKSKCDCITAQ